MTLPQLGQYVELGVKEVHVLCLQWDRRQQWGQIRPLNDEVVDRYYQSVKANAPRVPVRVLLRSMGGMFTPNRRALIHFCYHRRPVYCDWWAAYTSGAEAVV